MLLQIDASVIYGLGDKHVGKLTANDLKTDTPYNTYLHAGLPPTPIGMPSLASINAALHPASGTSLYYVARGDGTHEFTDTLTQHHQAIHRFRVPHLDNASPSTTSPLNIKLEDQVPSLENHLLKYLSPDFKQLQNDTH